MHTTLTSIINQLTLVISKLRSSIPSDDPFGNAHNNWTYPGLTRSDLIAEAELLVLAINQNGIDELPDSNASELNDYIRRLEFLHSHTIPNMWGKANQAVPAFIFTLQGLRRALTNALPLDTYATETTKLQRLQAQVRSMEARLLELEPRTTSLAVMVSRIENAHDAADQLPADLASLVESRAKIASLIHAAAVDSGKIEDLRARADKFDSQLRKSADDAKIVLERCETAYSAATSVGLAAAFSERSQSLSQSMWFWVAGLIGALAAGSYFGSNQLHSLSNLFQQPNIGNAVITLNLALSILSVAAPVWFGWLATKQIGQRFRLAEDYAFKASISRAYEGFRREAARVDKDMEAQLLLSALNRLDEQPLRLVELSNHASPWHELAASDAVKEAMRVIPGFTDQIKELASSAISAIKPSRTSSQKKVVDESAC